MYEDGTMKKITLEVKSRDGVLHQKMRKSKASVI